MQCPFPTKRRFRLLIYGKEPNDGGVVGWNGLFFLKKHLQPKGRPHQLLP